MNSLLRWISVLALMLFTGCAGVKMNLPDPDLDTRAQLVETFQSPVTPSRNIPPDSRLEVVNRVDRRIVPAAVRVCQRTFNNPEICSQSLYQRTLTVYHRSERVNAFVGQNYDVSVLGGLVRMSGSDDELAFVLAHEYTHALMGHVQKGMRNQALGQIVGGLAGIGLSAATGAIEDTAASSEIVDSGIAIGGGIGALRFSKGMELEADHLALFIVHEAGYNMDKAMDFFQRTYRMQHEYNQAGQGQVVGFFQTHPSDEERLMRLTVAAALIRQGMDRPRWKK